MASISRAKYWPMSWLLLLASTSSFNLLAAEGRGVESLVISLSDDAALIEIIFSCPNRYLGDNFPGKSDYLQIDLQRMGQCGFSSMTANTQEVELPRNRELAGLTSVEYQVPWENQGLLRLRFDRAVSTFITESDNQRRLIIKVEESDLTNISSTVYPLTGSENIRSQSGDTGTGVARGDRPMSEPQLESLMGEGRASILEGNYDRAIQVYTRVLRAPENAYTPQALEMLGLSRERNNQIAQAVAEYRRYLENYPQHEGADRVSQRLAGLVTANRTPQNDRAAGGTVEGKEVSWDIYGGISQYYRGDSFKIDGQDSIRAQSSILSNLDLIIRRKGGRMDFSSRVTAGNLWDLLGGDKGPGTQTRVYQGYMELADQVTGLSGRIGRQTLRNNGVLGRFDGMHVAWDFKPGMRFNLMGGYPVDTTADGIETRRSFLGAAIDFDDVADLVDLSFFYNVQKIDGLENREAIGTEMRYFDDTKSLVALVDYDIGFSKLNNFLLMGNWRVNGGLTLSASVDQRTSPYLTTRNALMGQPAETIEDLLRIYSEDEIRKLAESRSGEVTSFRLGASQSLSERFQLNTDFSMSDFQGSAASVDLPGYVDQARQYYATVNLVGSNLFMNGDTSVFGLRYTEGGSTATSTLYMDSRLPLSSKFQLNPRFRLSYRDNNLPGSSASIIAPSLRLLYRVNRRNRMDCEAGGQWINMNATDNNSDRSSWFLYCGYRSDF